MTWPISHKTIALAVALFAVFATALRARTAFAQEGTTIEQLDNYPPEQLFSVENGSIEQAADKDGKVLRWHINAGQTSLLSIAAKQPLLSRLRYFDRLQFQYRIAGGEINDLGLEIRGGVSGPRSYKIHQWGLAVLTTDKGVWHDRDLDLTRPNWFPWDNPDGEGTEPFFRFESLGLAPGTVIEFRHLKLYEAPLFLKPDYELPVTWPVLSRDADGNATYTSTYSVLNTCGKPTTIDAKVVSAHTRFKVAIAPASQALKNGAIANFTVTTTISKGDIAATPELYAEPLTLQFAATHAPDAFVQWHGELVRPLSPGYKTQVIASDDDVQFLRTKIAAGDAEAKDATHLARVLLQADQFVGIRLDSIPGSRSHPNNNIPKVEGTNTYYKPGRYMPEIQNPVTGQYEAGTALSGQFWKEYLGYGGVAQSLGEAWLLTGDEKYAAKAVELFELYGKQYRDLDWSFPFNPPWSGGPATLSSSRSADSSTYGSNWYFKYHCKLLSMISGSQAWHNADKKAIYEGFVLPYATEIMKFDGGIGNMTDITNCNLLLLGIVFDDAGLVHHALYSDPGLIRRLNDITPDGFSSEGRPLNYHFAAMAEYVPALTYLAQSGLKVDYQKDKLLGALRMPFLRATLWGAVPLTGDMGRGWTLRTTSLADDLLSIFPDQDWLADIGQGSTLAAKARIVRTGRKPDDGAWHKLVSAQPQLFADAGLAILRSGDTPETQIQVSLDYGRNVYHSALDRNQVTLAAFGKMYTQGTGSLYNGGSGGVTYNPDKKMQSFMGHGSLGQNVVLIDGQDQLPSVGKLVAFSAKPDMQYAVSRVEGIAPGVAHTRAIVLTKGIVVMLDHLASADEHTYDFIYHNFGDLKLDDAWHSAPTAPLGNTANLDNIEELAKLQGTGTLHLTWDLTGEVNSFVKAPVPAVPAALSLFQLPATGGQWYSGYTGMNNTNTAILANKTATLFQRAHGKNVDFVTVLEPYGAAGSKVRSIAAGKNGGVVITLEGAKPFSISLDQLTAKK